MNRLLRPFPILISLVSFTILVISIWLNLNIIRVQLLDGQSIMRPTGIKGFVVQLDNSISHITDDQGWTSTFTTFSNDRFLLNVQNYKPVELTIHDVKNIFTVKAILYKNSPSPQVLNGKITKSDGTAIQGLNIICDQCPRLSSRTTTDQYGKYSLNANGESDQYTLHFKINIYEIGSITIKPETKVDRATIDIAFDDSGSFAFGK